MDDNSEGDIMSVSTRELQEEALALALSSDIDSTEGLAHSPSPQEQTYKDDKDRKDCKDGMSDEDDMNEKIPAKKQFLDQQMADFACKELIDDEHAEESEIVQVDEHDEEMDIKFRGLQERRTEEQSESIAPPFRPPSWFDSPEMMKKSDAATTPTVLLPSRPLGGRSSQQAAAVTMQRPGAYIMDGTTNRGRVMKGSLTPMGTSSAQVDHESEPSLAPTPNPAPPSLPNPQDVERMQTQTSFFGDETDMESPSVPSSVSVTLIEGKRQMPWWWLVIGLLLLASLGAFVVLLLVFVLDPTRSARASTRPVTGDTAMPFPSLQPTKSPSFAPTVAPTVKVWNQVAGPISIPPSNKHTKLILSRTEMALAFADPSFQNNTGFAQLFVLDESLEEWVQFGNDLVGDAPGDRFGQDIDISGSASRLVVCAGVGGYTRVFESNGRQMQKVGFDIGNPTSGSCLVSVSGDGSRIASITNTTAARNAVIKVYDFVSDSWQQVGDDIIPRGGIPSNIFLSSNGIALGQSSKRANMTFLQSQRLDLDLWDEHQALSLSDLSILEEPTTSFSDGLSVGAISALQYVRPDGQGFFFLTGIAENPTLATSAWDSRGFMIVQTNYPSTLRLPVSVSGDGNTLTFAQANNDRDAIQIVVAPVKDFGNLQSVVEDIPYAHKYISLSINDDGTIIAYSDGSEIKVMTSV